jgi:hypothetical protein
LTANLENADRRLNQRAGGPGLEKGGKNQAARDSAGSISGIFAGIS